VSLGDVLDERKSEARALGVVHQRVATAVKLFEDFFVIRGSDGQPIYKRSTMITINQMYSGPGTLELAGTGAATNRRARSAAPGGGNR